MKLIKFILDYWAQLTIVIAAMGYLLKVILDYRFKKKEIWHTIYVQKKMDCLLKYSELHYRLESEVLGTISLCKRSDIDPLQHQETDVLQLAVSFRSAGQLLSQLKLFLSKTEFEVLSNQHIQIGKLLQTLTDLLQKRNPSNSLTEEFEALYTSALNTIKTNDKNIISLNIK